MTETKHTPGPWKVRENLNGTLGIDAKEPDGTPCQPAKINGDATDSVYGPMTWANARLIAAAPELLAFCKKVVWISEAFHNVLPELVSDARDLIARAESASAPPTLPPKGEDFRAAHASEAENDSAGDRYAFEKRQPAHEQE